MSSSTSYSRPALSEQRFARLTSILADANETHAMRASAAARTKAKRTFHGRLRAQRLGLAVDTVRAIACPAHHVAALPPPIIERATPPPRLRTKPTLRIQIPGARRAPADVPTTGAPYSTIYLSAAPAPAAAQAPTVLRGQQNPWRGPTSRFSLTPDDPLFTLAPRRAPLPPAAPPIVPVVPFDEDDVSTWMLMYPASGAADYAASSTFSSFSPSASASSSAGSSASSSGTSRVSSAGPATPADLPIAPFALSAKRKSEDELLSDKRPKHGRKTWARGRTLC
ncbi:hypothetical protein B0H15DRAFT_1027312 [Mycena belliarum]|uniref:Uncharacterized protein n=1 Tax=Mycena belliarum TaxID=1033014 RepID=A0AAD6XIZ7_9AGAR|nr:hypothetical protein B0H15DRAFT_1027312 [Mycena belliae]